MGSSTTYTVFMVNCVVFFMNFVLFTFFPHMSNELYFAGSKLGAFEKDRMAMLTQMMGILSFALCGLTCTCATAPSGATEGQSQALGLSSLAFGFYFAYLVGTGNAAALGIPAPPMYFWCIYNALTGLILVSATDDKPASKPKAAKKTN